MENRLYIEVKIKFKVGQDKDYKVIQDLGDRLYIDLDRLIDFIKNNENKEIFYDFNLKISKINISEKWIKEKCIYCSEKEIIWKFKRLEQGNKYEEKIDKSLERVLRLQDNINNMLYNKGIRFLYTDFINYAKDIFEKEYKISDSKYIKFICDLIGKIQEKINDLKKEFLSKLENEEKEYKKHDKNNIESYIKSNENRIESLKAEIDSKLSSIKSKKENIEKINQEIRRLNGQDLKEIELKKLIDPYKKNIDEIKNEIRTLEEEKKSLENYIKRLKKKTEEFKKSDIELKHKIEEFKKVHKIFLKKIKLIENKLKKYLEGFEFFRTIFTYQSIIIGKDKIRKDAIENYQETIYKLKYNSLKERDIYRIFPNINSLISIFKNLDILGYFDFVLYKLEKTKNVLKYEKDIISLLLQIITALKNENYFIRGNKLFIPISSGLLCTIECFEDKKSIGNRTEIYLLSETEYKDKLQESNIRKYYTVSNVFGYDNSTIEILTIYGLMVLNKNRLLEISLTSAPILLGFNNNFVNFSNNGIKKKKDEEEEEELWDD